MELWTEYSTKTVFQNAKPGRAASPKIELLTARNAYVSAQVIMRNISGFTVEKLCFKEKPDFNARLFRQDYRRFNDNAAYPDRLALISENSDLNLTVRSFCSQGFWVDFYVPEDAKIGVSHEILCIETNKGVFEAEFVVNVFESVLPKISESRFNHEYFFDPTNPIFYGTAERFSEKWWAFIEETADRFKELRNNAIIIHPLFLLGNSGSRRISETEWSFDFACWDRYVDIFLKKGAAASFTISAICQSVEGKWVDSIGYNGESVHLEAGSSEAGNFLKAIFCAIYRHISEKGMLKMYRTHIQDEPHTCGTWQWARDIIRQAAPDLPCGEPLDMIESSYGLENYCDIMVPRVNVYEEDPAFFRRMMKEGTEVWTYSCCFPEEGWWLNKFIDLPFIRSRIMEWNCVGTGAKGFLHWGFNYYSDEENSMYGVGAATRFKGDGHIVYPHDSGFGYEISTRFINTRDGNQDAELLIMKSEKDPERVKAIINKVVRAYNDFSDDGENFNEALRELLEV